MYLVSFVYFCTSAPIMHCKLLQILQLLLQVLRTFFLVPAEFVNVSSHPPFLIPLSLLLFLPSVLHDNKLTHTDLKPENILFVNSEYSIVYNTEKVRDSCKKIKIQSVFHHAQQLKSHK